MLHHLTSDVCRIYVDSQSLVLLDGAGCSSVFDWLVPPSETACMWRDITVLGIVATVRWPAPLSQYYILSLQSALARVEDCYTDDR